MLKEMMGRDGILLQSIMYYRGEEEKNMLKRSLKIIKTVSLVVS